MEAAAKACGSYEDMMKVPALRKLKLCKPQMVRLSILGQFVQLRLTDIKADPEREEVRQLRLLVKRMSYQENLCVAKGRIHLVRQSAAECERADGGGGTRKGGKGAVGVRLLCGNRGRAMLAFCMRGMMMMMMMM